MSDVEWVEEAAGEGCFSCSWDGDATGAIADRGCVLILAV